MPDPRRAVRNRARQIPNWDGLSMHGISGVGRQIAYPENWILREKISHNFPWGWQPEKAVRQMFRHHRNQAFEIPRHRNKAPSLLLPTSSAGAGGKDTL